MPGLSSQFLPGYFACCWVNLYQVVGVLSIPSWILLCPELLVELAREHPSQFLPGYFTLSSSSLSLTLIVLSIPSWILPRLYYGAHNRGVSSQFLPGYFADDFVASIIDGRFPLNSFLDTSRPLGLCGGRRISSQFLPGYFRGLAR